MRPARNTVPSRLTSGCHRRRLGIDEPLQVLSVTFASGFLLCCLISCRNPPIGHLPESAPAVELAPQPQQPVETSRDAPVLPQPIRLVPIESKSIWFARMPLVVPLRLTTGDKTARVPPREVQITTADGTSLTRPVRWLAAAARSAVPLSSSEDQSASSPGLAGLTWTISRFTYREVTPDEIAAGAGQAVLPFVVIDAQKTGDDAYPLVPGPIWINDQLIEIQRVPAVPGDLGLIGDWSRGPPGYQWPDMQSPGEAFRRSLLLQQGHIAAEPGNPPDDLRRDLGRVTTARWRLGLRRLRLVSPGVADEIVEVLTRRSQDGSTRFAVWPVDPGQLAVLERLLLADFPHDPDHGRSHAIEVLTWIDDQPDCIFWIESDHGSQIHLAGANLTRRLKTAEVAWSPHAGRSRYRTTIQMLPFNVTRRVIARPTDDVGSGSVLTIAIQQDAQRWTLPIQAPRIAVQPPGVVMNRFAQSWRLETWSTSRTVNVAPGWATQLSLRRGPDDRWELFAECRVPTDTWRRRAEPFSLDQLTTWQELAGTEAITIFIGPYRRPDALLTVTPQGKWRQWRGADNTGLEIHARIRPNGWVVRIVLPESWMSNQLLDLGIVRTQLGDRTAQCLPRPSLPWRADPGRLRFDLSQWQPMPRPGR